MKIISKSIYLLLLTLIMFVAILFFVIIPLIQQKNIERKKVEIRDLTIIVHDTITYYATLTENGLLSEKKAKDQAKTHLRSLRYGPKMKGYFWIISSSGVVILNPYRPNLEGKNQLALHDNNNNFFIKKFIKQAKIADGGFVSYRWFKKNNSDIYYKKISYVNKVDDWDWIIGTGLYVDDIHSEIGLLSISLLLITSIAVLTIAFILHHIFKNIGILEKRHLNKISKAKKTETKIKLMLEAIPDMLLRVNLSGKVLDIKEPSTFKSFISPGKILGSKIDILFPEEYLDDAKVAIMNAIKKSQSTTIIFNVKKRKNKAISLEAYFVKCSKDEVLITIRDISPRNKK